MRAPALLLGLALACAPLTAFAGGSDPAAAEGLFREGREAARRGDFGTACKHFGESQRLDPAPGTLLNMAECEEKLGKIASAWAHLREALDALPPNDDRVANAAKQAAALEPRLPRLVVRLAPTAPKDARIERDGAEVGAASVSVPLPIDPGSHRVVVKAAGHYARSYTVDAVEGKSVEILVDAGDVDPTALQKDRGGSRTLGYLLLGGGGLAAGAGVVTGLLAINKSSFMNEHCDTARRCDQDGLDAGKDGRTFDTVSTISFIAAGVLVAGGIVWIVTHPSKEAP